MRGKLLIINFTLVILAIVAITIFAINWSKEQKIENVSVSGNELLSRKSIMENLDDTLINHKRSIIKAQNIEKLLKQNPYIQETYITNKNLNELKVEVKERIPVAVLVLENGELAVIDKDMNLLPYQVFENFPDVPLIKGVFSNGKIDSTGINGAVCILNQIAISADTTLYPQISEIKYNRNNKNFDLFTSESGLKVMLGKNEDINLKIDKLACFLKSTYMSSKNTLPKYLDLRWSNHIIAGNL